MPQLAVPYFQLRKGPAFDRRPRLPAASVLPIGSLGGVGAFQEFYCTSGGSNVNSGDDENAAAYYTTTNGNWNSTSGIFTPTDGSNPSTAGVMAGKFVSIYVDGATLTTLVCLVLTVENAANGRIFVHASGRAGPGTATSATGRTLKAGGSWLGPTSTGSVTFPVNTSWAFSNTSSALGGKWIRINVKNDRTYTLNAGLNQSSANCILQGYSITPGDGGKATIDLNGTSAICLTMGVGTNVTADLILTNNGGTNQGIQTSAQHSWFFRVVVHDVKGNGFDFGNTANVAIECEAYLCNTSRTVGGGAFVFAGTCSILYCVAHDNIGSTHGFVLNSGSSGFFLNGCIADSNGGNGFYAPQPALSGVSLLQNCDFYGNGLSGVFNGNTTTSTLWLIRSCNFVGNGRYGYEAPSLTTGRVMGYMMNCGFGTGSQANRAGFYLGNDMMFLQNEVRYAPGVTPYLDPTNGKFDIVLQAAISAGTGSFTTTQASYGPTVGYPDIGAAQAQGSVQFWAGADLVLPEGYVNHSYDLAWTFPTAETISLVSGSLPPGLSLTQVTSSEWTITGTPTTIGTYDFTLRATIGSSTGDATFHITILDDPDSGSAFAGGF